MDRRLSSDRWQLFLDSDEWKNFKLRRILGTDGFCDNLRKLSVTHLRHGAYQDAAYQQAMIDGVEQFISIMEQYHVELEKEVSP